MRVWLDDERPMPEMYTHHAKTADEAIALLATGKVDTISLDYDLGMEHAGNKTGYDVARYIEENALNGNLKRIRLRVHTHSEKGRGKICKALQVADLFWRQQKPIGGQA